MEGTVEERVLDIQTEKRELVTKAFRERNNGARKKTKETRLADINRLLGAGPAPAAGAPEAEEAEEAEE